MDPEIVIPNEPEAPEASGPNPTEVEAPQAGEEIPPAVEGEIEAARKLRAENRALRVRAKQAESQLEELRTAARAAADEQNRREQLLQRRLVERAVIESAREMGFQSPNLAARLLDLGRVELDEGGEPVNLETLLGTLLAESPELAARAGSPRRTNPASGSAASEGDRRRKRALELFPALNSRKPGP